MKKKLFLWAAAGFLCALTAACEDDTTLGPDPEPFPGSGGIFTVRIDGETQELTFGSRAPERYRLIVESNKSWWVEKSDWLIAEKQDGAVILTAGTNRTLEDREGEVVVTDGGENRAVFPVRQQKGSIRVLTVDGTANLGVGGIPAMAVSANGRYVMGSSSAGTWVCDLETLGIDNELYKEDLKFYNLRSCKCVTDFGEPTEWGSNYDGSLKVDFRTVSGTSTALRIKDGQQLPLDGPGEAQMGTITPHGGYEAYWISEDGSYIAGKHIFARGDRTECGWRLNAQTGHYDYIFYDEGVTLDPDEWSVNVFTFDALSPGGKYTAGRTTGQSSQTHIYPYYRDLETGKYTLLEQYEGLSCSMITDDGIMSLAGTLGATSIFDLNNPEAGTRSLVSWLEEVFGVDKAEYELQPGLIRARGINVDRNTACWSYYPDGNPQALKWSMIITIQ